MKLDVQPIEDHQVKIIAELEPLVLEEFMRRAARKISRETRIAGFRPGKAPYDMVRRQVGEEALQQQAVEDLIDEYYPKILDEANVKPGAMGSLEKIVTTTPPTFSFIVPLEPTVDLGAYKDIRMDYTLEPVTEKDVDEFIQRMRTNYATAEPVEHPAEDGDLVYVKFSGKIVKPAEGEDENVFPERPAQFIIGNDVTQNRNWPYPGFNDTLKGMSAGEEKKTRHTFAKDDPDDALKGKKVEFKVMVQSVKSLILPELTDEFAQTVGQFETVADFQKTVREQLEANRKDETDDSYFTALIDKVIEGATIKYPPQVLEFEVEHLMEHLKDDVSRQGMELDAYFKMIDKEREQYIDEEIRPAARKRLERSLVMDELAKAEEIKLEQDDYNQAISATVSQLQSQPKPRKAKEKVNSNLVNNLTMNELSRTFNVKVLERMKAIATAQAPEPEKTVEPEPVVAEVEPAKVKKAATSRKPRVPAEPKTE